jgi:CheY-like chemotaxis protein
MSAVRRRKVLIVGECSAFRAKVRMGVERSGVSSLILDAANAFEALALLTTMRLDLVLVSSQLNTMDGNGLISRIHRTTHGRSKCMLVDDETPGACEGDQPTAGVRTLRTDAGCWSKVGEYLAASVAASQKAAEN